jgi:hypothetical protein
MKIMSSIDNYSIKMSIPEAFLSPLFDEFGFKKRIISFEKIKLNYWKEFERYSLRLSDF